MSARLPKEWMDSLDLPLIAAPMFLVSSLEMVIAACENGVMGSFPTVNARTPADLELWFAALQERASKPRPGGRRPAPWSISLIVHSSNARLGEDLALCVK